MVLSLFHMLPTKWLGTHPLEPLGLAQVVHQLASRPGLARARARHHQTPEKLAIYHSGDMSLNHLQDLQVPQKIGSTQEPISSVICTFVLPMPEDELLPLEALTIGIQ